MSLREECLLGAETDELPSQSSAGEEGADVELRICNYGHDDRLCADATARDGTLSFVAACSSESTRHGAMVFGLWNYRMARVPMTHFPDRRIPENRDIRENGTPLM